MRNNQKCSVVFFFYLCVAGNSQNCKFGERSLAFIDMAVNMLAIAKTDFPVCSAFNRDSAKPVDCEELLRDGETKSGVYTIWPRNRLFEDKSLDVYCDMETDGGGWTVIQRRGNFNRSKDYFYKDWNSYKQGFGDIKKDFWLGNDNIFGLTNQRLYSITFDLKDVEGNTAYALYDTFWIDDENHKYRSHIKDYSGTAGDSMKADHDNQAFSTKDQKNDISTHENCAQLYKGGWWYRACHEANLNGLYLYGKHASFADGVIWLTWKGYKESLAATEMKIRPKNFKKKATEEGTPKI